MIRRIVLKKDDKREWETEEYFKKIKLGKETGATFQYNYYPDKSSDMLKLTYYEIYINGDFHQITKRQRINRKFEITNTGESTTEKTEPVKIILPIEERNKYLWEMPEYLDMLKDKYELIYGVPLGYYTAYGNKPYDPTTFKKKKVFKPAASKSENVTVFKSSNKFKPKSLEEINYSIKIENINVNFDYDELKEILNKAGYLGSLKVLSPKDKSSTTTKAYANYMSKLDQDKAYEMFQGYAYHYLIWNVSKVSNKKTS